MASVETICLQRPSEDIPWGFRLHGGRDFQAPLTVQKVTGGSIAATGLSAGDVISRIGDTETAVLTHAQAMQTIKNYGNSLQLGIVRQGGGGGGFSSYAATSTPTPTAAPQSPPRFNTQHSTGDYNADYPFGSVQPANQPAPYYTNGGGNAYSTWSPENDSTLTDHSWNDQSHGRPAATPPAQPQIPDAILNMAAKGGPDKKPFAYVADVNDIREQRDRVRKRTPTSAMPRYQQMLNMPQFEDPAPVRHRSVPRTPPAPVTDESGAAVVSNLQFNTPIGLYSGDNVVEALKGQTGGQVAGIVGGRTDDQTALPPKEKSDFTQSAVYKMIHGIDQPKPKAAFLVAEANATDRGGVQSDDEAKFSGLTSKTDIPSKTFQRLQSWTGTTNTGGSEIDTTSIRRNVTGSDTEEPGNYNQKSIRYTGRNIPSRSFRMLQSMTGGEGSSSPARETPSDDEARYVTAGRRSQTPSRGTPQRTQSEQHVGGSEIDYSSIRHNLFPPSQSTAPGEESQQQQPQDVGQYDETSIRYTGKNIPSRSFRMLQQMTGGDAGVPPPVPAQHGPRRQPQRRAGPPPQHQQPPPQQPYHQDLQQHEQAAASPQSDDQAVDRRYVGGHIPSQSFRILQQSIGAAEPVPAAGHPAPDAAVNGGTDTLQSSQGRRVKVVRLRSQTSVEEKASGATEF